MNERNRPCFIVEDERLEKPVVINTTIENFNRIIQNMIENPEGFVRVQDGEYHIDVPYKQVRIHDKLLN